MFLMYLLKSAFVFVECAQFIMFLNELNCLIYCGEAEAGDCVGAAVVEGDAAGCLVGEGSYREADVIYKACCFVWELRCEHVV